MCKTPDVGGQRSGRLYAAAVALGIAAYTVVFTALAVLRYRAFYAYDWGDLAGINQVMWNTVHARWFYQSVTEQYFMGHFQPILALLALPYWALPRVETLLLLQVLGAALGAVPVYVWGRRVLGAPAGLAWAWAYLLYSPLHNVTLTDFRPVVFCIPLMLAALYALERRRFGWFSAWCVATVFVQENLGLWVAFLGLYALARRMSWKWVVMPIVLGLAWFGLSTRLLMPIFFRDVVYPTGGYLYLWIGNKGAGALVSKLLHNPVQYAMLALSPSRVLFMFKVLWPLCFLPFAAPLVMAVPAATWFQLLMVNHSALHATRLHWLAPMIPTFFFAAILGTRRLRQWAERGGLPDRAAVRVQRALVGLPLLGCALSNFGPNALQQTTAVRPTHNARVGWVKSIFEPRLYRQEAEDRIAWRAIATVPRSASVSASCDLMPPLSSREKIYEFGYKLQYTDGRERDYLDADYLVLHARCESHGAGVYSWPGIVRMRETALRLIHSAQWAPVFVEGNFLVLRRVKAGACSRQRLDAAARHIEQAWSDAAAARRPGGLMDLARAAAEAGDLDKALELYLAAAAMSPNAAYPVRKAAEILWLSQRYDDAVAQFGRAVQRAPLCFGTCIAYAKALFATRRLDEAERQYKRAIRLLPTDPEPYAGLGMVRLARGDIGRAERAFRRAVRLDPSFALAKKMLERCRDRRQDGGATRSRGATRPRGPRS